MFTAMAFSAVIAGLVAAGFVGRLALRATHRWADAMILSFGLPRSCSGERAAKWDASGLIAQPDSPRMLDVSGTGSETKQTQPAEIASSDVDAEQLVYTVIIGGPDVIYRRLDGPARHGSIDRRSTDRDSTRFRSGSGAGRESTLSASHTRVPATIVRKTAVTASTKAIT
jgi:hypothetical protein